MTVTRDTPVIGVDPSISRDQFVQILQSSDAASEAGAGYDAILSLGVDPAFLLAVFQHESNFGTTGICHDYATHSPGNTRTTRLTTITDTIIATPKGPFVKYNDWTDGFADAAFRLVDSTFVYAQEKRKTISQIIARWAPEDDGNDPNGYANSVVASMNNWTVNVTISPKSNVDDPQATWLPSPNFDAGGNAMNLIILHTTEGSFAGSEQWLDETASQASAQYIVPADGSKIVQLVREKDTAWGCGNLAYNKRAIQIEQEGYEAKGGFSDGLYATVGALVGRIAKRHSIPLDRAHIIGHDEVPDPNNPSLTGGEDHHTDPGPYYDFDKVIAIAKGETPATTTPVTPTVPTGPKLGGGFKAFYDHFASKLTPQEMTVLFGDLLSEEMSVAGDDGKPLTVQFFERMRFEWHPGIYPEFWDVELRRYGAEEVAALPKQATKSG